MIKVYIEVEPQSSLDLPLSLVFWPNFKFDISPKRLFLHDIMAQYQNPFFTIVTNPAEADFFAVPYEYFFAEDGAMHYLERIFAKAKASGKKVLLFDYTDYVDRIPPLPTHAVLFRVSVYRHHKRENEILMPYFVEDMGKRYSIGPQPIAGEPSIGYCGQADFANFGRKLKAIIKWLYAYALLLIRLDAQPSVHQRGIFWRKRALSMLRASGLNSDIITRSFYSLHQKSGSFDAQAVRQAYVENLRKNDFAFCARGDANASQRFYEALSASRIPLFLDTDCVLPLEEVIDYDRVMLRVPSNKLKTLADITRAFIGDRFASKMEQIERDARVVYDEYLRMDRFFSLVFDREKSPYAKLLFTPRT